MWWNERLGSNQSSKRFELGRWFDIGTAGLDFRPEARVVNCVLPTWTSGWTTWVRSTTHFLLKTNATDSSLNEFNALFHLNQWMNRWFYLLPSQSNSQSVESFIDCRLIVINGRQSALTHCYFNDWLIRLRMCMCVSVSVCFLLPVDTSALITAANYANEP